MVLRSWGFGVFVIIHGLGIDASEPTVKGYGFCDFGFFVLLCCYYYNPGRWGFVGYGACVATLFPVVVEIEPETSEMVFVLVNNLDKIFSVIAISLLLSNIQPFGVICGHVIHLVGNLKISNHGREWHAFSLMDAM